MSVEEPTIQEKFLPQNFNSEEYKKFLQLFNDEKKIVTPDDKTIKNFLIEELSSENFQLFIDHFQNNYKVRSQKCKKNPKKSAESLKLGKKLLQTQKHNAQIHEEAWKFFTKSITLAAPKSEQLALAYYERSSILLHLGEYRDSIKDANRAFDITKNPLFQIRLQILKLKCGSILSDKKEIKEAWENVSNIKQKMDKILSMNEEFLQLMRQAKDIYQNFQDKESEERKINFLPLTTDFISLKNNDKHNLHLTVNQNIDPGELVMSFKPFVTSVNINKLYAYCSNCLAFSWSNIPCDYCVLSMYCSENCKSEAWLKYHSIECHVIPHLLFNNIQYYFYQMSLRSVIMGIKEMGCIEKLREQIELQDKATENELKHLFNLVDFWKDGFMAMYNLPFKCDISHFIHYMKIACRIIIFIIQVSNIFEKHLKFAKGKDLAKNDDVIFICFLIMKIIMIAANNACHVNIGTFECKKQTSLLECIENCCCSRGLCISLLPSFIKNDCNPNVSKCFTNDGKIVYYSNRLIKKKEQIFVSRFNNFYENNRELREKLLHNYYITCTCKACTDNWSVMKDLFNHFRATSNNPRYKQNILSQKILSKYQKLDEVIWDKKYRATEESLKNVATDVIEAFKTCRQPSFITSILTEILCFMFEDIYGDFELDVSDECLNF